MSLEHYLAYAWAEHIKTTDGSLPLNQRLQSVDSRKVVDTFLGMLDKFLMNISPDDIFDRAWNAIAFSLKPSTDLWVVLMQCYADQILDILGTVKYENCYGCGCTEQYGPLGHPSQRHHTCLEEDDVLLSVYFTDCLMELDKDSLLEHFAEKLMDIDYVVIPDIKLKNTIRYELKHPTQFS